MLIRPATDADAVSIWRILEPMIRAGETYALPRDLLEAEALAYWRSLQNEVFVAVDQGEIIGTYFIRANQRGGGAHVCNCGYVTAASAIGKGVARAMCRHSLEHAKSRGYRAMQFNFVISSNERAVALWQGLGFETVGRIPRAFEHPRLGLVDALVMWRAIDD
jgi:ribosomal protein S18 acetylase RimI-like enzyme